MAYWSRTFGTGSSCSSGLPSTCCNSTVPPSTSGTSSIFDGLPASVMSTADAVGHHVHSLRRRLAARSTISSVSASVYTVVLTRRDRVDNLSITVGSNGQYPILVNYTTPNDSDTNVQFWSADQFLDYMVEVLK